VEIRRSCTCYPGVSFPPLIWLMYSDGGDSLMMYMDTKDLLIRANWDGAAGSSRRRLLADLERICHSPPLFICTFAHNFLCRINTKRHDGPSKKIGYPPRSIAHTSTSSLFIPRRRQLILIISRPSMQSSHVSDRHHCYTGGTFERSVEYPMESLREVSCQCE